MADILDQVSEFLQRLAGPMNHEVIVSAAPGGGPAAAREDKPEQRGGDYRTKGREALGFGGHGDAVEVTDAPDLEAQEAMAHYLARVQAKGLTGAKQAGRIRLSQPISIEAHTDAWEAVSGPVSLFDGTITAPGAGNSQVPVPIALPPGALSPVLLLDRYPGAMYMSLFIRSFSLVPTGTTMTGLQECWFTDIGGATCALGIYVASSQTAGEYTRVNSLLTTPITDPGNTALGNLVINNIAIGGTPVSMRYQLGVSYVAFVPDPAFNKEAVVPPTPAEIGWYLRSSGAQGM